MANHHGHDPLNRQALTDLFERQVLGIAPKTFSDGKIADDDEGDTAFYMGMDPESKKIILRFAKPLTWIGLDYQSACAFRSGLDKHIEQLEKMESIPDGK